MEADPPANPPPWDLIQEKCLISSRWIRLTKIRRFGLPVSFYPPVCVRVVLIGLSILNVASPGDPTEVHRADLLRILFAFEAVGAAAGVVRDFGALMFLDKVHRHADSLAQCTAWQGWWPRQWEELWSAWVPKALDTFIDPHNAAISLLTAIGVCHIVATVTLKVKLLAVFIFLDGTLRAPAAIISWIANAISEQIVKELRRTALECARSNEWSNFTKQYHLIGASLSGHSLRTLGDDATAMRAPELISRLVLFVAYTLTAMVINKEDSPFFTALFVVLALVYLLKTQWVLHKYAWHTSRVMSVDTGVHGIVLRERCSLSSPHFKFPKKLEYQIALQQFNRLPIGMTLSGILITKRIAYRTMLSAYVSGLGALYKIASDGFDK